MLNYYTLYSAIKRLAIVAHMATTKEVNEVIDDAAAMWIGGEVVFALQL